jgi:sulfite exporter TauE/SafE
VDFLGCNNSIFQGSSMLVSGMLTGLVGGFSHCAGMCGPFAITQTINNYDKNSINKFGTFERIKGAALLPYHLGRISTYTILAMVATYATSSFFTEAGYKKFSIAAIIVAALFLIGVLFPVVSPTKLLGGKSSAKFSNFISSHSKNLFANPRGFNGFKLGAILGLMPCALVFSALFFAAASGTIFNAATIMMAFGAGTIPALFITAYGGSYLQKFLKNNKAIFTKSAAALSLVALVNFALKII